MQIVIDIPEEVYKCVMDGTYCGTLYEELKTGTPLPEGAEILTKEAYSDLCTRAADVPSVEPERKPGIWTHEDAGVWICEVCGEEVGEMGNEYGVPKYNFCPYCGADMTGRR